MISRQFTIYAVESPIYSMFSGKVDYYHASLALIDETESPASTRDHFTPEQELHFLDDVSGYLTPRVYAKERHPNGEIVLTGYASGEEIPIRALWNRALQMAVAVRRAGVEFNKAAIEPWAFNCRSGVEAAVKAMGMVFSPGAHRTMSLGVNKNLAEYISARIAGNSAKTGPEIFEESARLTAELSH